MSKEQQEQVQSLVSRIESLEQEIFGTTDFKKIDEQLQLYQLKELDSELKKTEFEFEALVKKKKLLSRFFEGYKKIEPLLNGQKYTDIEGKKSIILTSESIIKEHASALHHIQQNEEFINSPNFENISELKNQISSLKTITIEQTQETGNLSTELIRLLQSYNKIVSALSQEFLNIHLLLTQLEQ